MRSDAGGAPRSDPTTARRGQGAAPLEVAVLPSDSAETDAEIAALLDACPWSFAQQTPAWRDVIRRAGGDEPCFLGCRRGGELVGVLPGYRFEGPLGAILTSCAQAGPLGGVACHPAADADAVYGALLEGFLALAAERGCAVATVISNPFAPDAARVRRFLAPDYALENVCQVLDLETQVDAEGGYPTASRHLRRNLRKARGAALLVDEEQSAENVAAWYEIHAARHREIGAVPLPRELFAAALELLVPRDRGRFFFVREAGTGEMVAGGFYVHAGSVIDALMPSFRSDRAHLLPNYRLADHSIRWARARGLRRYNWQPSPPESGIDRFKRQWGSRDVPYDYLTRVTGDVEPFLRSDVETLRSAYRWHYVLPFDRVGAGGRRGGTSTRRSAWKTGAEGG